MLLGWLHDASGGYKAPYVVAGGLSLAGAAMILMSGSATAPVEPDMEVAV